MVKKAPRIAPEETGDPAVDKALAILGMDEVEVLEDSGALDDEDTENVPEADVPEELTFTTSTKTDDADQDSDILTIKLDDNVLYARKPGKGAWALIVGAMSRSANTADKTQAILEFCFVAFDEPSAILLKNRLMDGTDRFELDDLSKIVSALMRKWAPAQSREQRRAALRAVGSNRR